MAALFKTNHGIRSVNTVKEAVGNVTLLKTVLHKFITDGTVIQ